MTNYNKMDLHETVLKLKSDIGQFTGALKTMHEKKPEDDKAHINYQGLLKLNNSKTLAVAAEEAQRGTLNAGIGMRKGS